MTGATLVLLLFTLVLVPLAGLFAAIDTALTTVSRARLEEMVRDERAGAQRLLTIVVHRPRFVALAVLLRTGLETGATVCFAAFCLAVFGDSAGGDTVPLSIAFGVMALVGYAVAGVVPRTLGRQHAYSLALATAWPLQALGRVLMPLNRIIIGLSNLVTPGLGYRNGPFASEVELREIVDLAQERGVVAVSEHKMIQSVFELGDTRARSVMMPRPDMVWIESDKNAGQAVRLAVRSGYSRIPVIGEDVDDVIGIVYLKDLVEKTYTATDGGASVKVTDIMRPPFFVPDSRRLGDLLGDMQRDRVHLAILIDEYGGVAGLISIEDILEEIVGEISDEYDDHETAPVVPIDESTWRLSARVSLDEVAALTGTEFSSDVTEEVDTIGGLIAYEIGRVPLPGAHALSHGLELTAEGDRSPQGRLRIHTVIVHVTEPAPAGEESTLAVSGEGHDRSPEGSARTERGEFGV